jgi:hypothetical protein
VETATVIGGSTVTNVDFNLPFVGTPSTYEFTFESGTMEGFTTEANSFWHAQYCDPNFAARPVDYFNSAHGTITRKVFLPDDGTLTQAGSIPTPYQGHWYAWYGQDTIEGWPATSEASYIGYAETNSDATFEGNGGTSATVPPFFGGSNSGNLISPPLDLKGYDLGKLSFWTWWEIESKNPGGDTVKDMMNIYVSQSPYTTWEAIGSLNPIQSPIKGGSGEAYTSGGFDQPGVWVNHVFDLSAYSGKTIEIKFAFDTIDRQYNGFRGWFLDDIAVTNSQIGVSVTRNHRTTIPKALPWRQ